MANVSGGGGGHTGWGLPLWMGLAAERYDGLGLGLGVVLAALGWASLLLPAAAISSSQFESYRRLPRPARGEWLSRVVSDAHAVLITPILFYAIFGDEHLAPEFPHRLIFHVALKLSLGYFLYDLVLVLVLFRTISVPLATAMHHLVVIAAVIGVFVCDFPLVYVWAAGLMLTEMSTPCVNQRWFMAIRHRHEPSYKVTGLCMTLSFFVARPLGIPAFLLWMFTRKPLIESLQTATDFRRPMALLIGCTASVILYVLNVHWFAIMLRGLRKALKNTGGAKQKSTSDHRNGEGSHDFSNGIMDRGLEENKKDK